MPWIKTLDEDSAEGELADLYAEIIEKRKKLSNIMTVQSLNPVAMRAHIDLYMSLMFSAGGLSRALRELIGVAVSSANECSYCISHHAAALAFYWKDRQKVERFAANPGTFELPTQSRAAVDYAIKLTESPNGVNQEDVRELREAGFDDEDILNINLITSYFNFVNRIVMGLGVEFSPEEVEGYNY
ncbi:MAG: peroxidase-related enzyme [bacterium]|nr:peroxidase-related enzyme [bacterium]